MTIKLIAAASLIGLGGWLIIGLIIYWCVA